MGAQAQRATAVVAHYKDLLAHRQATQEAREKLMTQVKENVTASGQAQHARQAHMRRWADALLRRQAEEAKMHARHLRQEAQAAVSSQLGSRGEALQQELSSIQRLMDGLTRIEQGGSSDCVRLDLSKAGRIRKGKE